MKICNVHFAILPCRKQRLIIRAHCLALFKIIKIDFFRKYINILYLCARKKEKNAL